MRIDLHPKQKRYVPALVWAIARRLKLTNVRALRLCFEWARALIILAIAVFAAGLAVETFADVVSLAIHNPFSNVQSPGEMLNSLMSADESVNA